MDVALHKMPVFEIGGQGDQEVVVRIMLGLLAAVALSSNVAATTIVVDHGAGAAAAAFAVASLPLVDTGLQRQAGSAEPMRASIVPEAATWAMLVAGFAIIGAKARRRLGRGVRSVTS